MNKDGRKFDKKELRLVSSLYTHLLRLVKKFEVFQIQLGCGPYYFRKRIHHTYRYPYTGDLYVGSELFRDGDIVFVEHDFDSCSVKLDVWSKKRDF